MAHHCALDTSPSYKTDGSTTARLIAELKSVCLLTLPQIVLALELADYQLSRVALYDWAFFSMLVAASKLQRVSGVGPA